MKIYVGPGRADLVCPKAADGPGHRAVHFVWQDGSFHADHHELELSCSCGERLIHAGGIDPWKHPHVEADTVTLRLVTDEELALELARRRGPRP